MLRSVLDEATGPTSARIARALGLLVEELRMDLAFVGRLDDDARVVVTHSAHDLRLSELPAGLTATARESLCQLITTAEDGELVADVTATGAPADLPVTASGIGAYAGVPLLVAGKVVGALCCVASSSVPALEDRDLTTLRTVADYVTPLLRPQSPDHVGSSVPDTRTELDLVAEALGDVGSVERLSRPLLEMLRTATGLDTTFLTAVDVEANQQQLLYASSRDALPVAEGYTLDWSDTLCRRSLDDELPYTTDVQTIWGDSPVVAAFGTTTYVSFPVLDPHSNVIGTLCGMSSRTVDVDPRHLTTMRMFAVLIGQQIAAQARATAQQQRALDLQSRLLEIDDLALRDPLTGLLNRRGIERWLAAASGDLRVGLEQVAIGFCDLDDFKHVNDTLGHAAGDDALRSFGAAIRTVGRDSDLHGRLGGDEFVVAAVLPAGEAALRIWTSRLRRVARTTVAVGSRSHDVRASVGVAAVTVPTTPEDALSAADAAMYLEKARRRVAP